MKKAQWAAFAAVGVIGLGFTACAARAAEVVGDYKRPNGDAARVSINDGKLYCKITTGAQAGFEMCHGMDKTGANVWQGSKMKHPTMPGMMTFNGTVTVTASGISIKGCAIGQSCATPRTGRAIKGYPRRSR